MTFDTLDEASQHSRAAQNLEMSVILPGTEEVPRRLRRLTAVLVMSRENRSCFARSDISSVCTVRRRGAGVRSFWTWGERVLVTAPYPSKARRFLVPSKRRTVVEV